VKRYDAARTKTSVAKLVELATAGEEIRIGTKGCRRGPGSAKGQILGISADFDNLPKDFEEYAE